MTDVSCPQCGNPQLDVDAENSVVYCKNCGFAVKIDPQTGEATPLSQGGAPASGAAGGEARGEARGGGAPAVYSGGKTIFGTDSMTFLLGATVILLILTIYLNLGMTLFAILETLALVYYLMNR